MENNTYINILVQSQNKKVEILNELIELTKDQAALLEDPGFNQDDFTNIIQSKEKYIIRLNHLDSGFQKIYNKVEDELQTNKNRYQKEIEDLKESITKITELSVKLQLEEKNNMTKLESYFLLKRKEIKDFKISKSTADSYQSNIKSQNTMPSYLFDTKK